MATCSRPPIEDLTEADAIVLANVQGPKDKEYLATADAFEFVKKSCGYGSNARVAARYEGLIGAEMVREFLSLLALPETVQQMLENRELTLEHGKKLRQLQRHRPDVVEEASKAMADLSAHDSRDFVAHLLNYPQLPVTEVKSQVLASKTQRHREFHVVAILDEPDFRALQRRARREGKETSALVTTLIRNWLHKDDRSE